MDNFEFPDVIKTKNFSRNPLFVDEKQKDILYKGVGLTLSLYENYYQYSVASPESFCYSKKQDGTNLAIGDTNQIVVAI